MIPLYRQRDFGEKINVTFQYAIQHIRSLGLALVYIAGPTALASGIVNGYLQALPVENRGSGNNPFFQLFEQGGPIALVVVYLVLMLLTSLAVILTTYGHLIVYNRNPGEPILVPAIWEEVKAAFGRSLLVTILAFFLVMLGTALLVLPGIYVGVALSLGIAVTVFEESRAGATIGRCFDLIRGKWWSTFGLLFVMSLIGYILALAFALPQLIFTIVKAMGMLEDTPRVVTILLATLTTIGNTLSASLTTLALAFQYFNLVERREGRGLLTAIDSIGRAGEPTQSDDDEAY